MLHEIKALEIKVTYIDVNLIARKQLSNKGN